MKTFELKNQSGFENIRAKKSVWPMAMKTFELKNQPGHENIRAKKSVWP